MHVFNRLSGSRIVAKPAALDAITWPEGSIALRFAADELYITPALDSADLVTAQDEHAIVISEGAFSGAWVEQRNKTIERRPTTTIPPWFDQTRCFSDS